MTKRAWAVCDRKGKPIIHTIHKTRRDIDWYCQYQWCTDPASWKRVKEAARYEIKRITITVD